MNNAMELYGLYNTVSPDADSGSPDGGLWHGRMDEPVSYGGNMNDPALRNAWGYLTTDEQLACMLAVGMIVKIDANDVVTVTLYDDRAALAADWKEIERDAAWRLEAEQERERDAIEAAESLEIEKALWRRSR